MHRGDWDHDWGGWWWLSMLLMMIAFWGGIVWVVVTLLRHGARPPSAHPSEPTAPIPTRLTPTEILAERLARGEIDPDEYRQRLDVLRDHHEA